MKTLITLSTILAAGSLAVNAATTIFSPTSTGEATYYNIGSWTTRENVTENYNTGSLTNTTLFTKTTASATEELCYSWQIAFTLSAGTSFSSSASYDLISSKTAGTGADGIILKYNNGALQVKNGSNIYVTMSSFDMSQEIKFTYVSTAYTSNNPKGFFVIENGTNTVSSALITSGLSSNNVPIPKLGNRSGNNVSRIWTAGGKTLFSNISVLYTTSDASICDIPEPSAFGLLAGIGALALAGTRRRRKMR